MTLCFVLSKVDPTSRLIVAEICLVKQGIRRPHFG